jgi:hypothetical protein
MTTKKKPNDYNIYFTGKIDEPYKNILISNEFYYLPTENQDIFNKLTENHDLCFDANWNSEFNILNSKNSDNIILYFDGVYGDEKIVSSAATIFLKDISYTDEFDDPPIEKKIKEIHLKFFCGTKNYSAASYLMEKIIYIMKLLQFHSIIIDTPILSAVEFYKMFGFKTLDGSSIMYLNNEVINGGRNKTKTKTKTKKQKKKQKNKKQKQKQKTKNKKQIIPKVNYRRSKL